MIKKLFVLVFALLILTACGTDLEITDPSLNASLEPNPVLSGSIEQWEFLKPALLKFRLIKKNTVGSALFELSNVLGAFDVAADGSFSAALPNPSELEPLLEDAKTTLNSLPCYGSSIHIVPDQLRLALAFLDLYWNSEISTGTQVIASSDNRLLHYDFKNAPVGAKFSIYAYADKDAVINANCGLLLAGSYTLSLNLKRGWNLATLEIKSRGGLFNSTDLRISTDGVPEGLKWFTYGANSNVPSPAPPEVPAPFPPTPIEPRATLK
jgi:hypothetical protein